jgi:hypothetical protein
MKNTLHIHAAFDHPELLEHMVEELASRKYNHNLQILVVNDDWITIETSSTETFVNGTISIGDEIHVTVNTAFTTQFLFTCSNIKDDIYQLNWAMSLN